jgi:hypothetical protein
MRTLTTTHLLLFITWVTAMPIESQEKSTFPDLTQTDPRGEFARGGKSYCAPVAVSNSLMWLYRRELDRSGTSQYDLVNLLASKPYMNTDPFDGTGPNGVMRGVRQFLEDRGLSETQYVLKFQGWRSHLPEYATGVREPRLPWIRETLESGGAVWLNLGWYRRDGDNDTYERVGGHWVTAVDAGRDRNGKSDPRIVAIHDPAPRAGQKPRRQFVTMVPLKSGGLIGKTRNLPHPAAGLFQLTGGMIIKTSADCAILDGAVALRIQQGK